MRWFPIVKSVFALAVLVVFDVASAAERPRLIVCVSVDQLCQDYLIRFGDNFAADGFFRRVEKEGAAFAQCHHRHAFTVTGPGHAVQLTGTYPNQHGIVGNQWFDRLTGKDVYCCDDPSVQLIGLPDAKGVSPRKLQAIHDSVEQPRTMPLAE